MYQLRKYCHPFERLELFVRKIYYLFESLSEAIRSKTIANFSNCSSKSIEKTQDVIRAKKNYQLFELVQLSHSKKIIQPSARLLR